MEQETTIQGFIPFRQIPTWEDDAIFELNGQQMKAIQKMFEAYTPFVQTIEPVFIKALEEGKIVVKYEDLQGNPMEKEQVDKMLEEYAKQMASQMTRTPEEGQ